jgi:uncharacterized membrane protein YgdD (TMEM256/DUF423 family)
MKLSHIAAIGGFSGAISVAAGAFGAHFLKNLLAADALAVFETGARYQMYHSLALLAVAWIHSAYPRARADITGWLFVAGIFLFSGSLYVLALTGARWPGAITPFGGLCFVGGWSWMGYSLLRLRAPGRSERDGDETEK